MIWAEDQEGGIGKQGRLPWPADRGDLPYFKQVTIGHTVIMGRRTWESLPREHRPLPGRHNIVLTRQSRFHSNVLPELTLYRRGDITVATSLQQALDMASTDRVFVMGGSDLYYQFLPHADFLYRSQVLGDWKATLRFPMARREWSDFELIDNDHMRLRQVWRRKGCLIEPSTSSTAR